MKLTNLIPIKAGKTLSRLCIIGALSLGSSFVFAQNQQVRLSGSNLTLKAAFKQIEQQTKLFVDYNTQDVNDSRVIKKVPAGNNVKSVLEQLLEGTNCSITFSNGHVIISRKAPASSETKKVTGVVKDEKGEPIIGANVVERGTTNGIITDIDGNFELNVASSSVLQITYIGYITQEIRVGDKDLLNVKLVEDTQNLDEVVVVGYGTQKKVTVTGSIAKVEGKQLTQSPTRSVSNSLSGRLSGVIASNRSGEPGNDVSNILIRGKSTLGSTSPLVVIDGVWGRDNLNQIDANDIESITVLKDASAAIYGAQAANGVILVTTKRGTSEKPTISYTMNLGMKCPTRLPELANSAEYAEVYNDLLKLQGQDAKYSPEEILKFRDGSDPFNYPNTDWVDETLKNFSTQQQHNLSLRGGNERIKYYISGNYSSDNSIFKNGINDYKNYGVRSNLDATVTNYIKIGLDISLIQYDRTSPRMGSGTIVHAMVRNYPYLHAWYPNGLPGAGIERGENPVIMATEDAGYYRKKVNMTQTTFKFDIKIPGVEGLGIDGFAAYDLSNTHDKTWRKPWTVYNYNQSADNYDVKIGGPSTLPELEETYYYSNRLTLNAKLKYEKKIQEHSVNAFIAIEQTLQKSNNFLAFRKNFMTDVIDQLYAGDEKNQLTDGKAYETARRNLFGRINYGYKERYLLDFNFRYDGSSNFPENKRWGFFPGISLGWRLSEESFIKNHVTNIDNLKLRASWGQVGNDQIDAFQYLASYSFTNGYYLGLTSDQVKGVARGLSPNPNITWEVASTYNIGLDASFWNGLLGVTFDLFKQKRSNILTARNASIPEYTGLKLPNENIGEVENKGFELELSHFNKVHDWQYSISGNVSFARNKILDIDEAANAQAWQMRTGHSMGTELYYDALGIYRTQEDIDNTPHPIGTKIGDLQYRDINDDGIIDSKDQIRLDKTNIPEIVFGLNLGISYKNFDFSALFQGQARAWRYIYLQSGLQGNTLKDLAVNRYSESNPNSKYPHLTSYSTEISGYRSTFWLKNSSFLRLKNIEIGYSVPNSLLDKVKIQKLRLYVSAFNLFTIDGLKWFDPEGDSETGAFYPQNKIFNFGLNLTF